MRTERKGKTKLQNYADFTTFDNASEELVFIGKSHRPLLRYDETMNHKIKHKNNIGSLFAFVLTVGLIAVGYLYYRDTQKPVEEKVTENAKGDPDEKASEAIQKIEKEVQVEAEAVLSGVQEAQILIAESYLNTLYDEENYVEDMDEVFYGIKSFSTRVVISGDIKDLVSEEKVRNKVELNLRRNGISVDDESEHELVIVVSGVWINDSIAHHISLLLLERVVLVRDGDFRSARVATWQETTMGLGLHAKAKYESHIITSLEELSDSMANRYLRVIDQEKKKTEP